MVINKKGQSAVLVFMIAVVVIILGLAFAFPVNEATTNAQTSMNCSTTTDDFVKAGCWVQDIGQGYFIGGILAFAGVIIAARILFS